MEGHDHLATLPDECMLCVIRFVGVTRLRLATLALVSRRFYRLSGDDTLWEPIFRRLSSVHLVSRITKLIRARSMYMDATYVRDGTAGLDGTNGSVAFCSCGWRDWARLLASTTVALTSPARDFGHGPIPVSISVRVVVRKIKVPLRMLRTTRMLTDTVVGLHGRRIMPHVWIARPRSLGEREPTAFIDDTPQAFDLQRLLHTPHKPERDNEGFWWEAMWLHALTTSRVPHACADPVPITLHVNVLCICYPYGRPMPTVPSCVLAHSVCPTDPDDPVFCTRKLAWSDTMLKVHSTDCNGLCMVHAE